MTVLAKTADMLAEYESGMLFIARRSDGHCVAMRGIGIAGDFRAAVKLYGAERAIDTYVRLGENLGGWKPLYKASAMPRLLGDVPA